MEEDQKSKYVEKKADEIYRILKHYGSEREIDLGVNLYFSGNDLDIVAAKIAKERRDLEKRIDIEKKL